MKTVKFFRSLTNQNQNQLLDFHSQSAFIKQELQISKNGPHYQSVFPSFN